jgi:hypothetical protein
MKFTPKTDEQIEAEKAERLAAFKPWPAGLVVDYEIKEAVDATSKAGNDMIKAHIDVYNDKGETKGIIVYFGDWNDYHFSRICRDRYEAGQVDAFDLPGKTGKCVLGIEKGGLKDDGTHYADKNNIKEFLKPAAPITKGDAELDDLINF